MKNVQYFCTRFRERHSGAKDRASESGFFSEVKFFFAKILVIQKFAISLQSVSLKFERLVKHTPLSGKRSLDDWKIKNERCSTRTQNIYLESSIQFLENRTL